MIFVSVIIPVYNHEKYIRECVESVLSQDYKELEVIVVDDGSTDSTPEILKEFGDKIHYIRQENQGASVALNNGIKLAQGSLIAWLSSDDVYLPGKISCQVRKFQENPSISLVYTDYILIDSNGKEIGVVHTHYPPFEEFARLMLKRNFINGSTILMKKECFEMVGYFEENNIFNQDADMWFRLLRFGYRFYHIPILLGKLRLHSSNISRKYKLMRLASDQLSLKVIQTFSVQELFGNVLSNEQKIIALNYIKIAWILLINFKFRASEAALKKANSYHKMYLNTIILSILINLMKIPAFFNLFLFINRILTGRFLLQLRRIHFNLYKIFKYT